MSCSGGKKMRRIYLENKVREAIDQSRYRELLANLPSEPFLIVYEAGEFIPEAESQGNMAQIVVDGSLSIYYIRDDGSTYSLAISQKDAILGDMEFFGVKNKGVFAEVSEKLTCLAIPVGSHRDALLKHAGFLRMLAESLAGKLEAITMQNAVLPSLRERVRSYMHYKCENGRLKGVENAAFHLHCSPRQLQRILNQLARDGIVKKSGKGAFELCEKG